MRDSRILLVATLRRQRWTKSAVQRSWFDGARPLRPKPRRSVKTTRGADSQFGAPPIHRAANAHPARSHRLAARRPGRPVPNGPPWPWRERPPAQRAWCGIAASVFSHPRRLPSRGRSRTRDPSGKGVKRRFEAAEDPFADRLAAGLIGIAAHGRDAGVAGGSRARPAPGPTSGDEPCRAAYVGGARTCRAGVRGHPPARG